jgi:hypothetical protein
VGAGVASRPVPPPYRGCDWLLSVGEPTFGLRFSPLLSGVGPLTIPCGFSKLSTGQTKGPVMP